MTDGLVLPPGAGDPIPGAGVTLKVGTEQSTRWSLFEVEVAPGFDVGAHRHREAEELFYILDGELDLLGPAARTRTPSPGCGPATTSSNSRRWSPGTRLLRDEPQADTPLGDANRCSPSPHRS